MKSFKSYMNESAHGMDLSTVHTVLAVPGKKFSERRQQYAKEMMVKLEAALAAKQIYNADLIDIKSGVGSALEYAYEDAKDIEFYPPLYAMGDDEIARRAFLDAYGADGSSGMQGAKKSAALWSKSADKFPGLLRVSQAQLALKAALEALKPFIIKGRAPKPVDPNKFVKPMASADAEKQVLAFLENVIADVRAEYTKQTIEYHLARLARVRALSITSREDFKKIQPSDQMLANRILHSPSGRMNGPYAVVADAEAITMKFAHNQIEMVLGEFLHKNKDKLALVVQKKSGFTAKVLHNRVHSGILETAMKFDFLDGASFKIYSQVEYAMSPRGKWFVRIPTRFTDVIMSNGQKMSMPSEEKMIKEF